MTLPESSLHRKPARLGLYAPFALLGVAIVVWTMGWLWARDSLFKQMDVAAETLDQAGYRVDWRGRTLSGYPFRLDLDLAGVRIRETSGWGAEAPQLKAEAHFLFGQDHWVIVAPSGVTLIRPSGGAVGVRATVLRASLSNADAHPPRVSVEGFNLTFTPAPGSSAFGLTSAEALHLHTRPGPKDQGAVYLEIDKAIAGSGWLADVAAGAPATLIVDALFSHAQALTGLSGADGGLSGAARAWSVAGGAMDVRRLSVRAGTAGVEAHAGTLFAGPDGRLRGTLPVTVTSAPRLMAVIAGRAALAADTVRAAQAVLETHGRGGSADLTLNFQAGETTLGPVAIGQAPRLYSDPRLDRFGSKAHN